MPSPLFHRFHHPAPPGDDFAIVPGSLADYAALARHHYRDGRPRTFTRIIAIRHHRPTVVGRFLHRTGESQTVAVLVESLPPLSCRLRDEATGRRYTRLGDLRRQARALNAEVRCISRVIVHPQHRGLSLAARLVRHALHTATTPITEAIAAMGNVHPFFEKAGMTAYRAARTECDARLIAALATANIHELDLARIEHTAARIESLPATTRRFLERELRRWHAKVMVCRRGDLRTQLTDARTWLLCEPVYYMKTREPAAPSRQGGAYAHDNGDSPMRDNPFHSCA